MDNLKRKRDNFKTQTSIEEYAAILIDIKQQIQKSQIKATLAANKELKNHD